MYTHRSQIWSFLWFILVRTPPRRKRSFGAVQGGRSARKFSNFFTTEKKTKIKLNCCGRECVSCCHTSIWNQLKKNQKEELTSPTRTKERTEHRSQTTTSYGNYYSKNKNKNISRKIKQEQAHNVRGNVFIKRQKIYKNILTFPSRKENLAENAWESYTFCENQEL